jgi:hypothetical protein
MFKKQVINLGLGMEDLDKWLESAAIKSIVSVTAIYNGTYILILYT